MASALLWCGLWAFDQVLAPYLSLLAWSMNFGTPLRAALDMLILWLVLLAVIGVTSIWYFRKAHAGLAQGFLVGGVCMIFLNGANLVEVMVFGEVVVDTREIFSWLIIVAVYALCGYVGGVLNNHGVGARFSGQLRL